MARDGWTRKLAGWVHEERSRAGASIAGPAQKDAPSDLSASARRFPSSAQAYALASRQSPVRAILAVPSASLSGLRLRAPSVNFPPASKPCIGFRVPDCSFPLPTVRISPFPSASFPDFSFLPAAFAPFGVAYRTSRGKKNSNSLYLRVSRLVGSQTADFAQGSKRLATAIPR